MADTSDQSGMISDLAGSRLTMLIGAAGTGKTTLVQRMAAGSPPGVSLGIVDADIGQSHLGPPGTVAWGRVDGAFGSWDQVAVRAFYFTGAVSPSGNLLQLVTGAKLMAEEALAHCERVVIDTTGMVSGPAARALKQLKVDILMPEIIIALEREDELAHILEPFRRLAQPRVISLAAHPGARDIGPAGRAEYRRQRLRSYFAGARAVDLSLDRVGLRFTRDLQKKGFFPRSAGGTPGPGSLRGRIVSLRNTENRDMALGIILGTGEAGRKICISTPLSDTDRVALVLVGSTEAQADLWRQAAEIQAR